MNLNLLPILRALWRNKVGAILIGLQIALTLAIVCNSLSIIQERVQEMRRPSGIDEANTFTLQQQSLAPPDEWKARIQGDLAALRSLSGVIDADAAATIPLQGGGGINWGLNLKPDQRFATAGTNLYFVDEHGLETYDLKLIAGRWFRADEVADLRYYQMNWPSIIVVTQPLAKLLFPAGNALGGTIYFTPTQPTTIVGIVAGVQSPAPVNGDMNETSTFFPRLPIGKDITYVVRTRPGQLAAMIRAAPEALYALTNQRVIQSVTPFSATRHQTYRVARATAVMLGVICIVLLTITAFGVIGLTTYWVTRQRRYIGMRRALGARRIDILSYFHLENLLIAGTGCIVGIALGLAVNTWLVSTLELPRMSVGYICVGALIVLALCQASVLWPATRAASLLPANAIRNL